MIITAKAVGLDKVLQRLNDAVVRAAIDAARDQTLSVTAKDSVEAIKSQFGKTGRFTPLAALTTGIKGNSSPLVDSGAVKDAVTSKPVKPDLVWVGVPRYGSSRKAHWIRAMPVFQAAVQIHEGKSIRVTDKMREMFKLLYLVQKGEVDSSSLTGRAAELWRRSAGRVDWRPLGPGKRRIKIPKRPYILWALNKSGLKRKARVNFRTAVRTHLVDAFK